LAAIARRIASGSPADHFGVHDAQVHTTVERIDPHRQWSRLGNIWHNAAMRSLLFS
jgi:hypothetical protein